MHYAGVCRCVQRCRGMQLCAKVQGFACMQEESVCKGVCPRMQGEFASLLRAEKVCGGRKRRHLPCTPLRY